MGPFDAFSPAGVGDGRSNGDPRTFWLDGKLVDPRTYSGPGMTGVTYAGPADANGYIAGQAPAGAAPAPSWGAPTTQPASWGAGGGAAPSPGAAPAPAAAPAAPTNPYMKDQADSIYAMSNQNLMQTVMPQIRSGAQAAGQYGSSRQGIAEGVAAGNANTGATAAIASLMGDQFNADRSHNLGMGQLELGNRNTDLTQARLGADLFTQGNAGTGAVGTGLTQLGDKQQQALWDLLAKYTNTLTPYMGVNGSKVASSEQGGGLSGALGGLLGGANLWALLNKTA